MEPQRAFLSHSSEDAEFVSAVAEELGRQLVLFDRYAFQNGTEFRQSIVEGFADSSVFVLFASTYSLSSDWVNFEQQEAWYEHLRGKLYRSLVFIIDSGVTFHDIPEWLTRGKISSSNSVKTVARDIRFHLNSQEIGGEASIFVGHAKEIEYLQRALLGLEASDYPHAPVISGLFGIGRRTVLYRAVPAVLKLQKFVEVRVSGGASIQEVSGSIATEVEPYTGMQGFNRIMREILQLSPEEAIDRSVANLRRMNQQGEFPILLDDGGLLDPDGHLTRLAVELRERTRHVRDVHFALVTRRMPRGATGATAPVVRVNSLEESETRHLLALLARRHSVDLSSKQIEDMASLVAGYPPAANFAVREAKAYGPYLVTGGRSPIASFLADAFVRRLGEEDLSENQILILRLLFGYSPLPVPVLARMTNMNAEEIQGSLVHLIDAHLISPTTDGLYKIADPVAVAIRRAFGPPEKAITVKLVNLLDRYIQENQDETPSFALVATFFRLAVLSGRPKLAQKVVKMSGGYYDVAQDFYERREYDKCIDNTLLSLQGDPNNIRTLNLLVRAYIQSEEYDFAIPRIRDIDTLGYQADAAFLRGFLERKRGDHKLAIEHFVKSGRTDRTTSRELASCYLYIGDFPNAKRHVDQALQLAPGNSWILDLAIQIEANLGDEDRVKELMMQYEDVGDAPFVNHRRARIALSKGDWPTAADYAERAVQASGSKPPAHFFSTWITALLASGDTMHARRILQEMNTALGSRNRDVRVACECNCLNAEGKHSQAKNLATTLSNQEARHVKKIMLDSLQGELSLTALSDAKRDEYGRRLRELQAELNGLNQADFVPEAS